MDQLLAMRVFTRVAERGSFSQAADELETCQRRRGEVTDVFVDNVPTWRLLAPVAYWRGRALEAQRLPATDAYRAFLAQKAGAEEPLAQDARRPAVVRGEHARVLDVAGGASLIPSAASARNHRPDAQGAAGEERGGTGQDGNHGAKL
jgi:hypothetical protein